MKQIVIAAHGCFASGLKSTIELILGPQQNLTALDCYLDDIPPKEKLAACIAQFPEKDDIILCTDLAGGSVNQLALPYAAQPNVHLITGCNVPTLLELILLEDEPSADALAEIIANGRQQLMPVQLGAQEEDDFDL